jgi:hypothetical protein
VLLFVGNCLIENIKMRSCRKLMALASLVVIPFAGCSDGGLKTVPVYGKVSMVGRELPKVVRVFFQPMSTTGVIRPSVAQMDADGSYTVKAFKDSDGLLPGSYRVQVSYFDLKPGGNPNSEAGWLERKHEAGELLVPEDADEVEHNIEVPPAKGAKPNTPVR